jgi:hypothetical protein
MTVWSRIQRVLPFVLIRIHEIFTEEVNVQTGLEAYC